MSLQILSELEPLVLDDSRPRSLAACIIHHGISLEIRHVQLLRLKPDGPVLQMPEPVVKVFVDRPRVNHLPILPGILFRECPVVNPRHHRNARQKLLNHLRVPADRNPLITVIKIVVVIGKPKRQSPDDEGRQLRARTSPLLLRVFSDQFFVDIRPGERDRLLFQILRDKCLFRRKSPLFLFLRDIFRSLLLDLCLYLLRCIKPPHLREGVHIERQVVELILVPGYRRIDVVVELRILVHILPDLLVRRMEDVSPVFVNIYIIPSGRIDIAADMIALVDHNRRLASLAGFICKNGAIQAGPDHQVVENLPRLDLLPVLPLLLRV